MLKCFPSARKVLVFLAAILIGAAMLASTAAKAEENDEGHGGIGIGISIDVMKLLKNKKKPPVAPAPAKKKPVAKPKTVSSTPAKPIGGVPPKGETRFRRDEVLFILKPASPPDALATLVRAQNLRRIAEAPLQLLRRTVHRYAITDGRTVVQVVAALEADPNIESAQPDYQYELSESASSAAGQQLQYANVKLRLDEAHKTATGKDVVVALIDSRIDIGHEALQHSVKESYSSVDYPSTEADVHGTAMAGAIAGHGQILGTAPQSQLLAVEVFSKDKDGNMEGVTFNILKGVDWAQAHAAFIINMSFAGPRDPLLSRLMNAAAKNGAILVAAAGNAGAKSPPLYPGADENALAVTATDSHDRLFKLANRGKYIAVAAPGVDIIVIAPGNSTVMTSGTSVAAAQISGLAALAMERAIKIDAKAFRTILEESANKIEAPANSVGAGRADALGLVDKAAELDPNQTVQQ